VWLLQVTNDYLKPGRAIHKGGGRKAPDRDGIRNDFFKTNLEGLKEEMLEIFNQMLVEQKLTEIQKREAIVCIPKSDKAVAPDDFRSIALLNSDYKVLARIVESRIRPALVEVLHASQYCDVTGKSIFGAVASVRDAVAYAKIVNTPLCVLSLAFKEAFDKITHKCLFTILQSYGLSDAFLRCIENMYTYATSVVHINGHISGPIPIQSSIRQGCPLNMTLFALCLNPLLHRLDQTLKGLSIHQRQRQSAVIAYADDITLLITIPEDIDAVNDAIQCYEKATGAILNIGKLQALPVGACDTTIPLMDIPYNDEITVLGFKIQKSIARAASAGWARITHMVRTQARDIYSRDLGLSQRIQYAHVYLLAKLWQTAQIYPAPTECVEQIVAAVARFIWQGAIFRVPISTLQEKRSEGGWDLTDAAAKCRALLITRIWTQSQSSGTITNELLKYWKIQTYTANPPDIRADTKSPGTPALLCPRNGVHQTPAADGTTQDISTSDVRHTVQYGPGREDAAGNKDNTIVPKNGLEASMGKLARNVGSGPPESLMV
jgi:hypothetical protein